MMQRYNITKRLVVMAVALVSLVGVAQAADLTVAERQWERANTLYTAGDYNGAVATYDSIVNEGLVSSRLFYNLANAYFKAGKVGEAILYYNKAAKLAPNDDDVAYNLAYAESFIKDKIESVPSSAIGKVTEGVGNLLSANGWGVVSLVLLALSLGCGILYVVLSRRSARKGAFTVAVVSAALMVVAVAFGAGERKDILSADEAIVLSSAAAVKSSPERTSKDLFILHEGTKVEVLDTFGTWREIRIADGNKGWIQQSAIALID